MNTIKIWLREDEMDALRRLALKEMRHYRLQAAYILRAELLRRGLLEPSDERRATEPTEQPTPAPAARAQVKQEA